MNCMKRRAITISLAMTLATVTSLSVHSRHVRARGIAQITLLRTPHEGIQPQTVLDRNGVLHMIYFKGDASAGDIEYVRRSADRKHFSQPIRVNSEPESAVAIGTVRGPQIALGRNGRVYVIWFGSRERSGNAPDTMPVFFSRLNNSGKAFEPQRNLMQYAKGGDGGLSIAADTLGDVYAVWHAMGAEPGEGHRRVYLARSADDGRTFAREVPISPPALGACGCCGMRAFADERGTLFVLYRAAAESVHRDMTLLIIHRPRSHVSRYDGGSLGTECLPNEYCVSKRRWQTSASRLGDCWPGLLRFRRTRFAQGYGTHRCARRK